MKRRSKARCGLECGASGAKLVLLTFHKSDVCVEQVLIEEESFESRSKGRPRSRVEITRELLRLRKLVGSRTVFVADEASQACFIIIPKISQQDADAAMLLQAKKLLSWERENPIMAHLDSDFVGGRIGSVVGLGDWHSLKLWSKLVEGAGGMVDDITVRACAYQALANRQGLIDEFGVFLIADFGASSSSFYILDHGTIGLMREMPIGGDAVTKALTAKVSTKDGSMHLDGSEAEALKIRGELSQVDMMIRPVVERMASEVVRSIQFFQENTGQKVKAVFITGGSSGLESLMKHLKSVVSVPVKTIDPFDGMKFENVDVKSFAERHRERLSVTVGLALSEKPCISLLSKPAQTVKRLARFSSAAVAILLAVGYLPFIFGGICQTAKIRDVQRGIWKYNKELADAQKQLERFEALNAHIQESLDHYRALESLVVRSPLWPGVLNALADAVPTDIALTRCSVDDSEDGSSSFILEGQVLPAAKGFDDAVASLLLNLNSSVFFRYVRITNADANVTEKMLGSFEIRCELVY